MDFRDILKAQLAEYFDDLQGYLDGLTDEERRFQPAPEANHIDFTLWHMARVEDTLVNRVIRKNAELWEREGWSERLGLPERGNGFRYTAEQAANLPRYSMDGLMAYYRAVRAETLAFIDTLSESDLDAVMRPDRSDDSVGGVLAHLIVEEAQHVGHVAYLRGMMRGIDK